MIDGPSGSLPPRPSPDRRIDHLHHVAERVAGRVETVRSRTYLWLTDPDVDRRRIATDAGLVPTRRLLEMTVPLPLPDRLTDLAEHTDPFGTTNTPEHELAELLRVNNAAFSWHPDQSRWTPADFDRRRSEPWFEPEALRMAWHDGGGLHARRRLEGFCWTKFHRPARHDSGEPSAPMGEIFVIAVDPAHQGRGLGRGLTIAGLAWQWEHHRPRLGLLYVEAGNTAARRTYERLGFETAHVHLAFEPAPEVGAP
ncbi:MAG: mycothiol synthase [Microthrixaceae bacterium]